MDVDDYVARALEKLGFKPNWKVQLEFYPRVNPLQPSGVFAPMEPMKIRVASDLAESSYIAHTIFHEMKHLVDHWTTGQMDEITPELFADAMCRETGAPLPPHRSPFAIRVSMPLPIIPIPINSMPILSALTQQPPLLETLRTLRTEIDNALWDAWKQLTRTIFPNRKIG